MDLLGSYTPVSVPHSVSRLTNMKVSKPTNMKVNYTHQHEPSPDLQTRSMFVMQHCRVNQWRFYRLIVKIFVSLKMPVYVYQ